MMPLLVLLHCARWRRFAKTETIIVSTRPNKSFSGPGFFLTFHIFMQLAEKPGRCPGIIITNILNPRQWRGKNSAANESFLRKLVFYCVFASVHSFLVP